MDGLICLIFFISEDYVIFVDGFMQNCLISFCLGSFHLFTWICKRFPKGNLIPKTSDVVDLFM